MLQQVREEITIAVSGTVHTSTFTKNIKGIVKYAVLKIPDFDTARTTILTVVDQYSQTIYTAASVNENTTTIVVLPDSSTTTTSPFPILPGYTITLTTSGATGGSTAYTAYLTLWIDANA